MLKGNVTLRLSSYRPKMQYRIFGVIRASNRASFLPKRCSVKDNLEESTYHRIQWEYNITVILCTFLTGAPWRSLCLFVCLFVCWGVCLFVCLLVFRAEWSMKPMTKGCRHWQVLQTSQTSSPSLSVKSLSKNFA